MLKIEKEQKRLVSLGTVQPGSLTERYDLKDLILNSPNEFFGEIGQKLFMIARDVRPSDELPTRIDLLALDAAGNAVAVLLPRGKEAPTLARALAAASLISQWKAADFFEGMSEKRVGDLVTALEVNLDEINRKQRAILIAEVHDAELLTGLRWLRERFGIDLLCVQAAMAIDSRTNAEFLELRDVSTLESVESPRFDQPAPDSSAAAPGERREYPRTRKFRAERLKLDYAGRTLGAKLLDYSEGGMGVEMLGPLPLGSTVSVSGELHSADSALAVEGRSRVAHCQYPEDSVFRIGLAFSEVQRRRLATAPEKPSAGSSAEAPGVGR